MGQGVKPLGLAVVLLLFPALAPAAEPFTATVVKVKDGDSLVVLHENKQIEIRLEGTLRRSRTAGDVGTVPSQQ